jgi:cbb3-type cytochrome oxidase subunit 3
MLVKRLLFRANAVYKTASMASTHWRNRLATAGIALLVICFLAGVVYSFSLPTRARYADEGEYLALSASLRHGPGYSMDGTNLTASRPPGYPFFVAAIQALGGNMITIRVVQYAIFIATLLLVYQLCDRERRFGGLLVVTILAMLYPALFYVTGTLYPQTLSAFLFVLGLATLLRPSRGVLINLAAGLLFGVLLLVVPTFALTLPILLLAAWWWKIIRWHEGIPVALGVVLVVGLWIARNEIVFHKFVPFATNSGATFLIGNGPLAQPNAGSGVIDQTPYYNLPGTQGLDEFGQDKFYRQYALDWIKANPGRAFVLYLEKTANYFNVYNLYAASTEAEVPFWKQVVMGGSYVLLLGLLGWRLVEVKRFPLLPREKLFLAVYVLTAFTMAIFVTRIRYRLPYDYLIITIVAMHLCQRLQAWLEPDAVTKST